MIVLNLLFQFAFVHLILYDCIVTGSLVQYGAIWSTTTNKLGENKLSTNTLCHNEHPPKYFQTILDFEACQFQP